MRPGGVVARAFFVSAMLAALALRLAAVTRLSSADGQFWDIQDTSPWGQDSGGIATGGRAYPFNGFGYLKLQIRRPDGTLLVRNQYLAGFGLANDAAGGPGDSGSSGRFDSGRALSRSTNACPTATNTNSAASKHRPTINSGLRRRYRKVPVAIPPNRPERVSQLGMACGCATVATVARPYFRA